MGLTYDEFKKEVAALTGVDLSAYKSQQMDRRLHSLMGLWGVADYDAYLHTLVNDQARLQEFHKKLTINVSEFFRNPERYVELAAVILPELCRGGGRLRVWSAGCANGAEAYTVAILLREAAYPPGATILATDIDRESLRRAQAGVYNPNEVRSVPPDLLGKYFTTDGRHYYLAAEVKESVEFRQHNLLSDPFDRGFDLIICRNVVIYLTEEAKNELYRKIHTALRPGGYMMVGGTEPLLNFKQYGFTNPLTAFYRKEEVSPSRNGVLARAVQANTEPGFPTKPRAFRQPRESCRRGD